MTIDGETFVLIKVVDIDEANVGDYVLYQGRVYKNLGYEYDDKVLEDVDTGKHLSIPSW